MKLRLLTAKSVARWCRGYHLTQATYRERALRARLSPLSPDAAAELDEICTEHIVDGEERTLFVVGTLLMRRGERRLWKRVFRECQETYQRDDELRFLDRMTVAARRGLL